MATLRSLDGLRILMTAEAVDEVLTYVLVLCRELSARGAEVHIATMGPAMSPAQLRALAAPPNVLVHTSTFATESMPNAWDDIARASEWLLRLERSIAPDLIHSNSYSHAAAGFRAPVVVVGHSCALSWWEAIIGGRPPPGLDRYRRETSRGLACAKVVIAPTSAMMSDLARQHPSLGARAVVANGARLAERRPRRQLPPKERSVLAVGRLWDPGTNLAALARVAPVFPGPVRVAESSVPDGTGRALPNVESLGCLGRVALGCAMDRAAIFAHPARYEPFGWAPLEAALRGCALVLGDIESLREVWGGGALYVEPGDDDALADTLEVLAFDGAFRRERATRAKARAETLTAKRMADGTVAAYVEALEPSDDPTVVVLDEEALSCA